MIGTMHTTQPHVLILLTEAAHVTAWKAEDVCRGLAWLYAATLLHIK